MVALCDAEPASENYVAAVHFCHGFATGAYQYHLAVVAASPDSRFVCLPDPPPSRSDAIADFSRLGGAASRIHAGSAGEFDVPLSRGPLSLRPVNQIGRAH